jgi:predicted P-loop ATPase/GTPase
MKKINQPILCIALFFSLLLTATTTFAQKNSKNENIGNCVSGIQISMHKFKVPADKLPPTSRKMFLKYSERVGNMAEDVYKQCKQIDSSCIRRVFKNNNDFEIMDTYFETFGAVMNGLDKDRLIALANTSCYLLNEQN